MPSNLRSRLIKALAHHLGSDGRFGHVLPLGIDLGKNGRGVGVPFVFCTPPMSSAPTSRPPIGPQPGNALEPLAVAVLLVEVDGAVKDGLHKPMYRVEDDHSEVGVNHNRCAGQGVFYIPAGLGMV